MLNLPKNIVWLDDEGKEVVGALVSAEISVSDDATRFNPRRHLQKELLISISNLDSLWDTGFVVANVQFESECPVWGRTNYRLSAYVAAGTKQSDKEAAAMALAKEYYNRAVNEAARGILSVIEKE